MSAYFAFYPVIVLAFHIVCGEAHRWSTSNEGSIYQPRAAICLVGGAREFELTGPSIMKHLIRPYEEETHGAVDVFISSILDEQSHKLWILQHVSNMAAFRIIENSDMNASMSMGVIKDRWAPSFQGMLQYFRMVEGCLSMIQEHQAKNRFEYKWIIRSRLDAYWYGPPPPLVAFNLSRYTLPNGSFYGGINDRFGVGGQEATKASLSRLTLLPAIAKAGFKRLNSERALKAQLHVSGIDLGLANFNFCVLSRRKYPLHDIPVVSMNTTTSLNGAKCRPCTPLFSGKNASEKLSSLRVGNNWVGPHSDGINMCDPRGDWEEGWERLFDRSAGEPLSRHRRKMSSTSFHSCVVNMKRLRSQSEAWQSPYPFSLCKRWLMGPITVIGNKNSAYAAFVSILHPKSILYNAIREIDKYGGYGALKTFQILNVHDKIRLGSSDVLSGYSEKALPVDVNSFAQENGHKRIDFLHVGIESLTMVSSSATREVQSPEICQLVVTLESNLLHRTLTEDLHVLGFRLDRCLNRGRLQVLQCTYYSIIWCDLI